LDESFAKLSCSTFLVNTLQGTRTGVVVLKKIMLFLL